MTQNIIDTHDVFVGPEPRPEPRPEAQPEPRPDVNEPLKGGLEGVDQLLRRPVWFVEAAARHSTPREVVRLLMLTVLAGAGLFGASMGLFRPGPQILSSAVKLPLVFLFTAACAAPAYSAARWVSGATLSIRQDILLFLSTLALTSLVLAALAPVVLLAVLSGFSYHGTILSVVACSAVAGFVGLLAFARAAHRRAGARLVPALLAAGVFALVGAQMAWTLRPFVARPRASFEVLREMEGSFLDSVRTTSRSARGHYDRDSAPLPERE